MEYYLEYIIILVLIVCIVYNLLPRKKEGLNPTTDEESDEKHRFVNYNTSWCYFSKQMEGTWSDLAKETKNLGVEIVDLKCDSVENEENEEICKTQGIEAYPTIKLHKQGGETVEYNGDRSLDSFKEFLTTQLSN